MSPQSVVSLQAFRDALPSRSGLRAYSDSRMPLKVVAPLRNTQKTDGAAMADMTREEIDAKLATVEARTETRFVELSGKLDRVVDSISSLRGEVGAVRTDNKFTRLTIIVAVVGSVIAGLAALWVTQSNMLASFSAGIALHDTPKLPPSTQK
jgi:hypothetical protein